MTSSRDAIELRDPEPAYTGTPGQTRYENVHLVDADGSLRSVSLCRGVNTHTHPELKQRAIAGFLHRLEDGRELAVPFVYHDPDARKFALVLPVALSHLELKAWSKLMAEIADDTDAPVPRYVRDCVTIIGAAALEQYALAPDDALEAEPQPIASGRSVPPAGDTAERESLLLQRERELAEQERALIRMAEGLTAREGELNRLREEIETARVDLEIRESELAELTEQQASAPTARGSWTEIGMPPANDEQPEVVRADGVGDSVGVASGHDAVAARTHPPPLPHRSRTGPPPLPPRLRPAPSPPPLVAKREPRANHAHEPPPLPHHAGVAPADPDAQPEVRPPAFFAGLRPGQMALRLVADELWLFVHLEEEHTAAFRRGVDLMLQYAEIERYPVFVLSLVSHGAQPHVIRLALDGLSDTDLRVLEHLSRSFRARVALFIGGVYCETVTAATLREGVAQSIAEEIAKTPREPSALTSAEALLRVLHAPPPLWNDDLPFGPVRREASSTATVLAAVEQLRSWLRPEKLREATLTYSVAHNVVEATVRRVLRAAASFGIALDEELTALAIAHRIAADEPNLVHDLLQAFRHRIEQGHNDLGDQGTRSNWEALLARAQALDVPIDDATRAAAESTPGGSAEADPRRSLRPLEQLSAEDLRAQLQSDAQRIEALCELCMRRHPSAIESVLSALDELEPAALPRCLAYVLMFGESVGDGLVAALDSPNPALRQLSALALGRLQLRRALMPLLRQLQVEDTPISPELARAFGDFGGGSLRTVVRSIPNAAKPDRLVLVLAHLANHGSAKEVERLENDADAEVAQVARKAMAKRSRMEWEDLAVREQRTLSDSDTAAQLSQAFYAELAKVGI